MKSIKTLIPDIYDLFNPNTKVTAKDEDLDGFVSNLRAKLVEKLGKEYKPELRMSSIGQPCARKLWYEINEPDKAEPSEPWLYLKFLFGDIIEQLVIFLAKTAGHEVTDEQRELVVDGVPGHTDGKVDGVPVDIKSASGPGFKKFQRGVTPEDDAFGYLNQLGLYRHALIGDVGPAAFVAFDKTTGEMALDVHQNLHETNYTELINERKRIVSSPEPPERGITDEPYGSSGNRSLRINCQYCPFKRTCWTGLRVFAYSRGPVFLSRVVKTPDVPELTL